MEKVLFITRSFPPSSLTATGRAYSFAKYLHEYGYYPVIITRNWDIVVKQMVDIELPSGTKLNYEKNEHFEVYYIPFKGRIGNRKVFQKNRLYRKIANLIDTYFGSLGWFSPHYDLYRFALKYVKKSKEIKKAIITVSPFQLLEYGYLLKKKAGIKWVADYRDEWTTEGNIVLRNTPTLKGIRGRVYDFFNSNEKQINREKKWSETASSFITVAPQIKTNLEKFLPIKGRVLVNGYEPEDFYIKEEIQRYDKFTITYAGSLYQTQQIEVLLAAVRSLAEKYNKDFRFQLLFIGGKAFPGMQERILGMMSGYEAFVNLTDRVSKQDSIRMQKSSHLLLLCAHKEKDSIPSSKLYEYMGIANPVLVCPTDNGIIQETLKDTGLVILCDTVEDAIFKVEAEYLSFIRNEKIERNINWEELTNYQRKGLVKILADELNRI